MTTVYCSNPECIHYDVKSRICSKDIVNIGEEHFAGCDSYRSFRDLKEYSTRYYISVKAYDSKGESIAAKAICYGKQIEYKGIIFYTTDRTDDNSYHLTHKRTGYSVGTMSQLEARWEKFIQREKEFPDVETLPLAELDIHYKYRLVKQRKEDAGN